MSQQRGHFLKRSSTKGLEFTERDKQDPSNSHYRLPNIFYDVSLENFVLDQLPIS